MLGSRALFGCTPPWSSSCAAKRTIHLWVLLRNFFDLRNGALARGSGAVSIVEGRLWPSTCERIGCEAALHKVIAPRHALLTTRSSAGSRCPHAQTRRRALGRRLGRSSAPSALTRWPTARSALAR